MRKQRECFKSVGAKKVEIIKLLYPSTKNRILQEKLRISENQLEWVARKLKIYKTKQFIKYTQLKKGCIPWNTGIKMTPEQYLVAGRTFFKKGCVPVGTLYDGAITVRKADNRLYKWIRLACGVWQLYHKYVWEQHHGVKIEKNKIIWFKDGNSLNCNIDNLECITRREEWLRNAGHNLLTDKYVAATMCHHSQEVRDELLNHPELIELKRIIIKTNRIIKNEYSGKNESNGG